MKKLLVMIFALLTPVMVFAGPSVIQANVS